MQLRPGASEILLSLSLVDSIGSSIRRLLTQAMPNRANNCIMTKAVLASPDPKYRVMTTSTKKLMIPFIVAIGGASTISGQSAMDRLQPLVETSARRLVLAREVALAKWDTRLPVEDPAREAQVIMAAAKDGESKGLNRTFVANFFAAQIDANKLIQYSLLAEWHRAGRAPKHPPVSLTEDIRPRLDQIEAALIAELVETKDIRANASCRDNTAKAVCKYLAHRHLGTLLAIALDRAMEANCSGSTAGQGVEGPKDISLARL